MEAGALAEVRRRRRRLAAWVAIGVGVTFGPALWKLAWLSWKTHEAERALREREAAYQALRAEHERLQSDPVYVEGLLRSTFKVAQPGELVVPLSEPPTDARRR